MTPDDPRSGASTGSEDASDGDLASGGGRTESDAERRRGDVATRRGYIAGATAVLFGGAVAATGSDRGTAQSVGPDTGLRDPGWRPADASPADADVTTTDVVLNLDLPWDLEFAGDDAFLTERPGSVYRVDAGDLVDGEGLGPDDLELLFDHTTLPEFGPSGEGGEGGALGVAAHPDYPDTRAIFLYYTADVGSLSNRIVRYDLDSEDLTTLVEGIPAAEIHNGGRLEVGPEGYLWATTADAAEEYDPSGPVTITQDPGSLAGAILRMTPEGEAPRDNPDLGPDADPRVFTYGHRNPQGVAFTPGGRPLISEHGPSARDEISALCPGGNYGWGIARGGPDDPEWESYTDHESFVPPLLNTGRETAAQGNDWDPIDTWAPSGATFYTDDAIPAYRNRLLVAGLLGQAIYAVSLYPPGADRPTYPAGTAYDEDWFDDRYDVVAHELFYQEWGRLRHVAQGPEGGVFVLTSNRENYTPPGYPLADDDRIKRIDPA